ncbi:MAG: hypothetical protein ACI828_002403, partial [Flavobacteriales bacterium]
MTAFAKAECYNIPIHEIEAPLENALKLVPCSPLEVPLNGATNVTVETEIRWEPTAANFGYVITIGTTPGGNEIVPSTGVGAAFFTPPTGLPENT